MEIMFLDDTMTGTRIRLVREHYNIPRTEFAKIIRIPLSELAEIEVGGRQVRMTQIQVILAHFRDVNGHWLLTGGHGGGQGFRGIR